MKAASLSAIICSCMAAHPTITFAGGEATGWVGEPRLEVSVKFGGGDSVHSFVDSYSFAFGFASRYSVHADENDFRESVLPITGLSLSSLAGFQPLMLGTLPATASHLSASEDESSFSWGWLVGAVAAGAAVVALASSDSDSSGNDDSQTPSDGGGGQTINGIGPSDGDGECDLATSNGGEFTLVESECTDP